MKLICVAIDIEKAGCMPLTHPIVSIGFVVGHKETILEKKRFNFAVDWRSESEGGDFEDRCINEFWSQRSQDIIDGCKENALPAEVVWPTVVAWINELETTYPAPEHKIYFLTDNGSFDVAGVDNAFQKYAKRKPMRYSSSGVYRSVVSADDMFYMLGSLRDVATKEIKEIVVNDHNPVNDAHYVYMQYYCALKYSNQDNEWGN
jgi:hypothetical protein